jgi:membrane protein DedA with SNARE-associated domain
MMNETTFTKIHSALNSTLSRRGMWWIFFGKLIPSVKAFIPVVAGLARTKTSITSCIFFIASVIWATLITSLGYYFGEHVSFRSLSTVSFVIAIIVIFVFYTTLTKRMKKDVD